MTIKMNLPDGTSIGGNAEELFELGKLLNDEEGATILIEGDDVKIIDTPSKVKLDYFKKVKTPSDRELSFLKAGREVGELRKGDIVKLEGIFIDRFHKVYDVYKDTADVGSLYEDISQMSLVTPVDERLDLSDDDK